MKRECRTLQNFVATNGTAALRADEAAQDHLAECNACFEFLERFAELDNTLSELSPIDAPQATVDRLLAHPELASAPRGSSGPSIGTLWDLARRLPRPRLVALGSASAALLLLAVFVMQRPALEERMKDQLIETGARSGSKSDRVEELGGVGRENLQGPAGDPDLATGDLKPLSEVEVDKLRSLGYVGANEPTPKPPPPPPRRAPAPPREESAQKAQQEGWRFDGELETLQKLSAIGGSTPGDDPGKDTESRESLLANVADLPLPGRFYQYSFTTAPGVADFPDDVDSGTHGYRDRDFAAVVGRPKNEEADNRRKRKTRPIRIDELDQFSDDRERARDSGVGHGNDLTDGKGGGEAVVSAARAFFDERSRVEGLSFREAAGYWSNTYVPGDPALRLLESRLRSYDRETLQTYSSTPLGLHDGIRRTRQPFDAPENGALAAYLHSDRTGADGESRMLLQVGLQATERRGGRRPAMNVAMVLDLRSEPSDQVAAGMRAVLTAFGQARDVGDRFQLVVAGRDGGLVVRPDDFRHGYLTVTLDRLLGGSELIEGPRLDLVDAISTGIDLVASGDDPTAALGTSAVVLITGSPLGAAAQPILDLAHLGAVSGVPLSAVGIGDGVNLDQIDAVALAGQGNRRLLQAPSEASGLVDRELSSVGRAIARAVRLRIRLAPGVELIDVLGARRLDEIRAEQVRTAERSIDQRIARNLGIEADRGDDEDGIQIVIPTFYSGDSHVVLLDVKAAGPGAVAEVTVRYKDLVYMRNGIAQASLSLGREPRTPGPLEANVLENLLDRKLSDELLSAGDFVRAGRIDRATAALERMRSLLDGLEVEAPSHGFDLDPTSDLGVVAEYLTLLHGDAAAAPALWAQISDSLLYASRLKVLTPLARN